MLGWSHHFLGIYQYFGSLKCLGQGHYMAAVGFEPWTSRSGAKGSTTEPPRPLTNDANFIVCQLQKKHMAANKLLYMAFVNLEKAFDRAPRDLVDNAQTRNLQVAGASGSVHVQGCEKQG